MRKFISKAKSALSDHQSTSDFPSQHYDQQEPMHHQPMPTQDQASEIQPPTPMDVAKYRYQHGTNLGTVFVLERWLVGGMFEGVKEGKGSAELAGVEGGVKVRCCH